MKALILLLPLLLSCISCKEKPDKEKPEVKQDFYPVLDYKIVKLHLDTLNIRLREQADSNGGKYIIPYTELSNGQKRLVFFGTSHVRNVDHPQFSQLIDAFNKLKPEVAFNEGGNVRADQRYPSVDHAINANGEIGLLKFLCDSIGIRMLNGDMDERQEMAALLAIVPKDQLYLYMAMERFLYGYKNGHYQGTSLEEAWRNEFIPYVQHAGLGLSSEQQSFDTLKSLYRHYLNKDFNLDDLAEVHDYYLTDHGLLGDIGRATKIVRDQVLLSRIDSALSRYDRVMVVFGGSHRIAVEPALKEIIMRK